MADLVLGHLTPLPWPPPQVHMVLEVRNSMMEVLRLKINVKTLENECTSSYIFEITNVRVFKLIQK